MPQKRPHPLTSINTRVCRWSHIPKMGRAMRGLSLQRAGPAPPWPPFLLLCWTARQLPIATSQPVALPYLMSAHTADVFQGLAAGSGPLGHLWRRGQGDEQGRPRPKVASVSARGRPATLPDPFVKSYNSSPRHVCGVAEQMATMGGQAGAAAQQPRPPARWIR